MQDIIDPTVELSNNGDVVMFYVSLGTQFIEIESVKITSM